MFPTVTLRVVKVLARRERSVLVERDGRTLEIPFESLWSEDDDLVVGTTCDLEVHRSWARANGLDRA